MSFLDIDFPKDIAYNAVGGSSFSTNVIQAANSSEMRNVNWQDPIHKYNISYGLKTFVQMKKLADLFLQVKGRAHSFRFHDWFDYDAYKQELKKIDDNHFQFVKTYGSGSNTYERKITKLVKGRTTIWMCDKSLDTCESDPIYDDRSNFIIKQYNASVDYDAGIIIIDNDNTNKYLIASFHFDVSVRFDIDYLPIKIKCKNDFICDDIYLIEVRS